MTLQSTSYFNIKELFNAFGCLCISSDGIGYLPVYPSDFPAIAEINQPRIVLVIDDDDVAGLSIPQYHPNLV